MNLKSRRFSALVFFLALLLVPATSVLAGSGGMGADSLDRAADDDDVIVIEARGSALEYEQTEIRAEAGSVITVRMDNTQATMPHNIVFVREEADIRPVGLAGMRAHENQYIPLDEYDRILAYTSIAGAGEITEVTFEVPPPGEYPFVCTYPGHFMTMQGTLISVASE